MLIRPRRILSSACVGLIPFFACPGYAQDASEKVTLHGYFSQAYARSDNATMLGIPKGGTWNYRVLALQARYAVSDNDAFVVQGREQWRGTSLLSDQSPQIQWAYYQHTFDAFKIAVGKAPVPIGLYNNLREVGTVLPFYRASPNYYVPGYETIDGVVLSNSVIFGAWRLESTAYGGSFTNLFQAPTPTGPVVVSTRTEYNYGTQLWLETPIPGLRVGTQLVSYQAVDATNPADTTRHTLIGGSIDGAFDKTFLRAEYLRYAIPGAGPAGQNEIESDGYVEGGIHLTEELSINAQVPVSVVHYPGRTVRTVYDRALGIGYAPNPNVVFKVEGHRATGSFTEDPFLITQPQRKTTYGILSVATSF